MVFASRAASRGRRRHSDPATLSAETAFVSPNIIPKETARRPGPARSRVLLLERLRAHTTRHDGERVSTSFFFELPVDTTRYEDYVSRVTYPPICFRDVGEKLYKGEYADGRAVDDALRRGDPRRISLGAADAVL